MLRIKKLNISIVKSFLMLFISTLFICLFVLMTQFPWRYVDGLVGKGLEMSVMAQFFFYSALTLVPVPLPLAVLLVSLITLGNFGECYELLVMKAAGISFLKTMRPLALFVYGLVGVPSYFQNVVGPVARAKLGILTLSMKQKSPELDIPEGAFCSKIKDHNLKVAKKSQKTGMLHDMLIYSIKGGFEKVRIIYADSGRLETIADKQHFWLHLYSGDLLENLKVQSMKSENAPYRREEFREKHSIIKFNSSFNMADDEVMGKQSDARDMAQLQSSIDSMTVVGDSTGRQYYRKVAEGNFRPSYGLTKEGTIKIEKADTHEYNMGSFYEVASLTQRQKVFFSAINRAESVANDLEFKKLTVGNNDYSIRKHKTEWHKRITISLSCSLFFFIGAPLGGIIRKGELKMPVIISVLVFIIYYIIDNTGHKMVRDGKWIVWMGMWTSSVVLAPLGVSLTYGSNKDSVVLNADAHISWLKRIVGIRSVRHISKKEVIIHDPDYTRLIGDLKWLTTEYRAYVAKERSEKVPNYFKLWVVSEGNNEAVVVNGKLEALVEEMFNAKSATLAGALNNYPVTSAPAHMRPFHIYWLNLVAGVIFPTGLLFHFRVWVFCVRPAKDVERIIKNNE